MMILYLNIQKLLVGVRAGGFTACPTFGGKVVAKIGENSFCTWHSLYQLVIIFGVRRNIDDDAVKNARV